MIHTAWTARDGAPQNINALAQTADGTLWLGTRDGLYSFDGLTFSAFQPASGSLPRRNVQSVFATKNGDLWASGGFVRPTRIRGGGATLFDRVGNATFESLCCFQESSDETVWAILNGSKLVHLGSDGIWYAVPGPRPDSRAINSNFIDSSDTLWLVADNMLYRRARGTEGFTSTEIPVFAPAKFKEAPDHTIWVAGYGPVGDKPRRPAGQQPEVGLKHIDPLGKRLPNPLIANDDVTALVPDADGALWVSHAGSGLQRLRAGEMSGARDEDEADSPDAFGVADGLTTTGFRQLLRDRDGNIWSAGGRGIDRFQPATMLAAVPAAMNGWWSECVAPDNDVWLSLFDGFFAVIRNHRLIRLKDQNSTGSLLCDKNDKVWLQFNGGIAQVQNDRVERLPLLPEHGHYGDRYYFTSLAVLPDRRLLASTNGPTENRLWTYENGVWKPFLPASGITQIQALWEDARNNLYLGSTSGKIIVLEPPTYRMIYAGSSNIGVALGFSETSHGIFAFGENGIALRQNGDFRALPFANPAFSMTVTGLVEDRARDIWVNGTRAIARISSAEIAAAASDRSYRIQAREFREGEYRGADNSTTMRNSAQIDSLGRIWLPTPNGVIYIDPQHVDIPSRIPTPSIRSISADRRPLNSGRTFPPETQTVNVRYFAINLSNPGGVVYRYKLLGSDEAWQDVGGRSEAVYTHLRPGTYTFQVMASSGGERWSAAVASAPFTILPAFYQTWWFEALAALSGILLLWAALSARVRYVTREVRMRAEERATERIRIARELHDTLLQGVQGLLLSFHVAAEKVPDSHESKKALERALATADRIILEGRDRLSRLRSDRLASSELEPSIQELAGDLDSRFKIDFAMECEGSRKPLNPEILEEVYYIAGEALTNAFRHSGASRIVFRLDYGKSHFRMECQDNGRGFSERELREAESKGHWGLRGMSERAKRIGAKLSYEGAAGDGVRIRLVLRASRAYLRAHSFWRLSRFHKAVRIRPAEPKKASESFPKQVP